MLIMGRRNYLINLYYCLIVLLLLLSIVDWSASISPSSSSPSLLSSPSSPISYYSPRNVRQLPLRPSLWRSSLTQSTYYYADYKIPISIIRKEKNKFLPNKQDCPDSGNTVCNNVPDYPIEEIYGVIKSARATGFNLSSLFVDESKGDAEPNLSAGLPIYEQIKPKTKSYIIYQTSVSYDYCCPQQQHEHHSQQIEETGNNHPHHPRLALQYPLSTASVASAAPVANDYNREHGLSGNSLPDSSLGWESQQNYQQNHEKLSSSSSSSSLPSPISPISPASPASPATFNRLSTLRKRFSNPWKPIIRLTAHNISQSTYVTRSRRSVIANQRWLPVTRTKRQSRDNDETNRPEEVCRTRTMFITPKAALNDRSEWKFVVNLGEKDSNLKQVIKVDVCMKVGSECTSSISLPFGFKSRCKQKFIKKKLLALDASGQSTSSENFFVPSCCVCEIVRENVN